MSDNTLAAEKRGAWIAALEEEKRGYEVRGLKDRAKQVDEQIAIAKGEPKGRTSKDKTEA